MYIKSINVCTKYVFPWCVSYIVVQNSYYYVYFLSHCLLELFLEGDDFILTSSNLLYFEVIKIKFLIFTIHLMSLTIPKKGFTHL